MANKARAGTQSGKKTLPRISVIMPSFNHARFLGAAMDSVLSQNYPNLEYIVMDGGSKDGSADIIRNRASKLAYWQSERDGGQANALNLGLSHVTGDVIGWLNSDDLYTKGTLARVGRYFATHPDVMLLYGNCLFINEHDQALEVIRPGPFDSAKMAYRCRIMQMAVFFRREMLERIGSFDIKFPYALDYDLWLRAGIALEKNIVYLPKVLACFRGHEQSQSVRDVLPALMDAVDVRRKLVTLQPQPAWLEPISGDIFRSPLILLVAAGSDEAVWPAVKTRLSEIVGEGLLDADEWNQLGVFLTAIRPDYVVNRAGPALLDRIERLWIIACGGVVTKGHDKWLADMLVELGWRHLYACHVVRAFSLFWQACAQRPASAGQILRWQLVEWLTRVYIGRDAYNVLRGLKLRAIGLFLPRVSG